MGGRGAGVRVQTGGARFASPTGEPITSPVIRHRSFDGGAAPILDAPDANSIELDADGATRIGPLPHGITALALDMPIFAQTRVPNVSRWPINVM
jgi:hypothetical protein